MLGDSQNAEWLPVHTNPVNVYHENILTRYAVL